MSQWLDEKMCYNCGEMSPSDTCPCGNYLSGYVASGAADHDARLWRKLMWENTFIGKWLMAKRDYVKELEECECRWCIERYKASGRRKVPSPLP